MRCVTRKNDTRPLLLCELAEKASTDSIMLLLKNTCDGPDISSYRFKLNSEIEFIHARMCLCVIIIANVVDSAFVFAPVCA